MEISSQSHLGDMIAEYRCLKCDHVFRGPTGAIDCPKCKHLVVKWVNYEVLEIAGLFERSEDFLS
jgi:DNA-directed RNA polymerase subunit RPC12/RpoP